MLIARATKRDGKTRFARDARVDLIEDGEAIGAIVYAIGPETATITLRGETYRSGRAKPRRDSVLFRAAVWLARGGEAPPPNPILLTDAAGRSLAEALESNRGALIRMGDQKFEFRRRSPFSRRYDLYREGISGALGSSGQKSLFSTVLTSDLAPEVPALLQAFLFALLLDITFVALDRSSS